MGTKETLIRLQKEGANKCAYMCDPSDTITEVKEAILTKAYFTQAKQKFLVKAERDKIDLTLNEEKLVEGKTLGDYSIKEGDVLKYKFTAPLVGQ